MNTNFISMTEQRHALVKIQNAMKIFENLDSLLCPSFLKTLYFPMLGWGWGLESGGLGGLGGLGGIENYFGHSHSVFGL